MKKAKTEMVIARSIVIALDNLSAAVVNLGTNKDGSERIELILMHAAYFVEGGVHIPAASVVIRGRNNLDRLVQLLRTCGLNGKICAIGQKP